MRKLLYILSFLLLASPCWGATYDYYFDTSGGGSTCSQVSPCATLAAAQTKANAHSSGDTVNLYFGRGNTWTCDTLALTRGDSCFAVNNGEATINIDSYDSGDGSAKPVFDGNVSTWTTVSDCSTPSTYPCRYSPFFLIQTPNSSISNVEIKDVYGKAIQLNGYSGGACATRDCADGFLLSGATIYNIGLGAIGVNFNAGIEDAVVENCLIYSGQNIPGNDLCEGGNNTCWGAAINFEASGFGSDSLCQNNIIRHNIVYDIYGEGINASNSVIEYNLVGTTSSIALNVVAHDFDPGTSIIRWNWVIHEDYATTDYDGAVNSSQACFRVIDEDSGGDNTNADFQIYGNICVNTTYGARLQCPNFCSTDGAFGSVKIYNNTFIDNYYRSFYITHESYFTNLYIYNNSSIFYDSSGDHSNAFTKQGVWEISNNHFYAAAGLSPSKDTDLETNQQTSDPDLPGGPGGSNKDFDSQSGAGYYNNILFSDIYPPSGSPLIGNGYDYGGGFDDTLLTTGTDFTDLPTTETFATVEQSSGAYDIGAAVRSGAAAATQNIQGIKLQGVTIQ